jgi:RNA polymerase primary sigma factor
MPEVPVVERDLLRAVKRTLDTLSERERQVIELRFGLRNSRSHTLREVAGMMGITPERVRQLEQRALERLRSHTVPHERQTARAS